MRCTRIRMTWMTVRVSEAFFKLRLMECTAYTLCTHILRYSLVWEGRKWNTTQHNTLQNTPNTNYARERKKQKHAEG